MAQVEIEDVRRAVADYFGLTLDTLKGPHRTVPLARYRQLAFYLCRRHTAASFPAIGRKFGRDHTTVIFGVKAITHQLATDTELRQWVDDIERIAGLENLARKTELVADRMEQVERAKRRIAANKEAVYGPQSLWI